MKFAEGISGRQDEFYCSKCWFWYGCIVEALMNIVTIKACPAILYSAKGNRPVWLCYLYNGYTWHWEWSCIVIPSNSLWIFKKMYWWTVSACFLTTSFTNEFWSIQIFCFGFHLCSFLAAWVCISLLTTCKNHLGSVSWIPEAPSTNLIGPLVFFDTKQSTFVMLIGVLCKRLCSTPMYVLLLSILIPPAHAGNHLPLHWKASLSQHVWRASSATCR